MENELKQETVEAAEEYLNSKDIKTISMISGIVFEFCAFEASEAILKNLIPTPAKAITKFVYAVGRIGISALIGTRVGDYFSDEVIETIQRINKFKIKIEKTKEETPEVVIEDN